MSPPSPTTQWERSHRSNVQVATLRVGVEARPAAPPAETVNPAVPRLDLTAFAPTRAHFPVWDHSVRRVDQRFRVHLPEAHRLGDGVLVGRLRPGRRELGVVRGTSRTALVVTVDDRDRVHPPGVVAYLTSTREDIELEPAVLNP